MHTVTALLKRTQSYLRLKYRSFLSFGKRIGWWKIALPGGVVLGLLISFSFSGGTPIIEDVVQSPRAVSLKTVAELSQTQGPLPVVGIVKSQSQASVRTESSGQVTRVYRELGDSVRAGDIIAEMENSSQRAAVLQAEGSYEAAVAQAAKITGGARTEQRSILEANLQSAQSSLTAARTSAVNALLSTYTVIDDSVRRKTDAMFSNPDSPAPTFDLIVTDSQLTTDLQVQRNGLRSILSRQEKVSATLSSDDNLQAELTRVEDETRIAKNFIDKVIAALNKAVPSSSITSDDIASFQVDASAARTALTTALGSLASVRDTLVARESSLTVAEQNLEQGVAGGQAEDVASAEASVKQAQGSLAAARANLEKTIIRAPIPGVINQLSLERGDFLSSFTQVLTIANNGALEVIAQITDRDARELQVGGRARIEGRYDGVITRIAPALDPISKKIEVRIGLPEGSTLLNGEAVTVELSRAIVTSAPSRLIIPLAALKIGTESTVVFSVDENFMLVPHEVILGELLGDQVVIESGIDGSLPIVLDARGLKPGQTVVLEN